MRKRLLSTKEVGNRKGLNYLQKNNEAESEVKRMFDYEKYGIPVAIAVSLLTSFVASKVLLYFLN